MVKSLQEIYAAGATFTMHINYGDGYGYVYRCVAEPRCTMHIEGPKNRKSKRKKSQVFKIDDGREFLTLEEAHVALQAADVRMAQDAEWDKAAPRPKPAYIPGFLEEP